VVPTIVVLIAAGLHVPVTPLVLDDGKAGAMALKQNGPIGAIVGATDPTTMLAVLLRACVHPPAIATCVTVTVVLEERAGVFTVAVPDAFRATTKLPPPKL